MRRISRIRKVRECKNVHRKLERFKNRQASVQHGHAPAPIQRNHFEGSCKLLSFILEICEAL
jgi:hypothetical protein